jgi:hypothetical protein
LIVGTEHVDEIDMDEAELRAFVARARRTDPAATETAIRRFLFEIDEARAALDSLDLGDAPLPVAYSPEWIREDWR